MRLIDADTPIHVQIYDDMTEEWRLKETTVAKALDYWVDEGCPPTVDAVPVRHGHWIDIDEQSYTWKVRCSVCGHERSMMSTQGEYPNYCENCGARMDGES